VVLLEQVVLTAQLVHQVQRELQEEVEQLVLRVLTAQLEQVGLLVLQE
jgi:hypothetical protein